MLDQTSRRHLGQLYGLATRSPQNDKQNESGYRVMRSRRIDSPRVNGHHFHGLRLPLGRLLLNSGIYNLLDHTYLGHIFVGR